MKTFSSELSAAQRRYVAVEVATSTVVAMIFSTAFTLLLFGGQASIPLWGPHGLAIDTFPHTLGVLFPCVVVPTIITRRRLARHRIEAIHHAQTWLPRNLIVRALAITLLGLVLGGVVVGALELAGLDALPFATVLVLKIAYGGLLALAATPIIIRAALADTPALPQARSRL
jgi:hypothetical protein